MSNTEQENGAQYSPLEKFLASVKARLESVGTRYEGEILSRQGCTDLKKLVMIVEALTKDLVVRKNNEAAELIAAMKDEDVWK